MDTAAIIIVLAGAVALGGLLFGSAWFASRRWRLPAPAYAFGAAGALLGGVIGLGITAGWFSGAYWNERVPVAQVLPYMRAIKIYEPSLYERLETSILRDQEEGKSAVQVRDNAKALVASYVADKTPGLPDDLTYELYSALRDNLAYLAERKEYQFCSDFALGRFHGDIDPMLSRELVDRNITNITKVLAAKANSELARMPSEQFGQLVTNAFAEASQATGIPLDLDGVDTLLAGRAKPEHTCRLMKAFFDALLARPVDVAAAAFRTLASGEQSAR
jgi:hypothetical protein